VHRDGTAGEANDLGRSPGEYADHCEDSEGSKNDFGSRVTLGEFPETKNDHLRETDENQTEKNTLENGSPAVTEVLELVTLHLTHLDETFTNELEDDDTKNDKDDKNEEEDVSSEEDVGQLNLGAETDTFNTTQNDSLSGGISSS